MTMLFWPIAFLLIGLLLMIVEVFVPSGGFIGFTALFCVGLSLWRAFQYSTRLGAAFLVVDFAAVPLTTALAFWLWVRSPLSRRILLKPPSPDEIDVSHDALNLPLVEGREGRALTPLRRAGISRLKAGGTTAWRKKASYPKARWCGSCDRAAGD